MRSLALPASLLLSLASADLLITAQPAVVDDAAALSTAVPAASLDPQVWSPISTITGSTPTPSSTTPSNQIPIATPSFPLLDKLSSYIHHDILRRSPQVPGQVIAPQPTIATQLSPVTTEVLYTYTDGTALAYTVLYTQHFSSPLDQWPGPAAGAIGLGTIQGDVGVVKTAKKVKRDDGGDGAVQTQVPLPLPVATTGGDVKEMTIGAERTQEKASTAGLAGPTENKATKVPLVDSRKAAGSALALVLAVAAMVIA